MMSQIAVMVPFRKHGPFLPCSVHCSDLRPKLGPGDILTICENILNSDVSPSVVVDFCCCFLQSFVIGKPVQNHR